MRMLTIIVIFSFQIINSATLQVGSEKTYSRIEQAYTAATIGDTIIVFPLSDNSAYQKVALYLAKKITILGSNKDNLVKLCGNGYDYSGVGSTPRAMFQFNAGSDGSTVENLEIYGCHNNSSNGAGFRINQTNNITIRNCHIHENDMGLMSNGKVSENSASNQLVENCLVHDNGNTNHAGYNHNFYMGGTSVTIRGCNVHSATTGHNIKSRAHINIIEGCFVHDSPNREFDLVDESGNTDVGGSHSLISGCVVVKHVNCSGNKAVIHFGQDGSADHNGILYINHTTILTKYISPVVDLSSANAGVRFYNSIIIDPTVATNNQVLVSAGRNGASIQNTGGSNLWVSNQFPVSYGSFGNITRGQAGQKPEFVGESVCDYNLKGKFTGITDAGVSIETLLPEVYKGRNPVRFNYPLGTKSRSYVKEPDLGAFEYAENSSLVGEKEFFKRVNLHVNTFSNNIIGITVFAKEEKNISLKIFDCTGKFVSKLTKGEMTHGEHSFQWKTDKIRSGIYYISVVIDNKMQSGSKIVLNM